MLFESGLSFIISIEYNLIIPQLDVSKCNIELFNNNTLIEWKLFCDSFDGEFNDVLKKIKKYKTIKSENLFIKIPRGYTSSIWHNYPDLYECNGDQILMYLEKTQSKLSDIFIKISQFQSIINCRITPEIFSNLSISDYSRLTKILIDNGETNPLIWCSVASWWNYSSGITSHIYFETRVYSGIGTCKEKKTTIKQEIINDLLVENEDDLIKILDEYCCPRLFDRCNWFLMVHARAIINGSTKILNWINEHKKYVVWDEDLLSDTPSYAYNECYKYYSDNIYILNEHKKRFIAP